MISIKIITEYCSLNSNYRSICVDLLPKLDLHRRRRAKELCFCLTGMAENLQKAINALSLHDEEPVDLPDSPRFHVFDENATSLLGRLLSSYGQDDRGDA